MNDEIKEILNFLQYNDHIGTNDKRKLREYITNLQQDLSYYQNYGADMLHKNNILEERIEKTLEYLKYQLDNLNTSDIDIKAKMLCAMTIIQLEGKDNE